MTRVWRLETYYRPPKARKLSDGRRLQAWKAVFTLQDGRQAIDGGFTERTAVMRAAEAALALELEPTGKR